jgi:hypothetical protein
MTEVKEIWTEMWNFPTYEISTLGNVRRAKNERPVKVRVDGNAYNMVSIFYNKKAYTKRLGKLVWQSFNKCDCNESIDHIDRVRTNDTLGNLRCVPMDVNYANREKGIHRNKYNLTPEMKGLIYRNYRDGIWSTWDIMKEYGMPLNYIRTTMLRGSWKKFAGDENI